MSEGKIESLLKEDRLFEPPAEFAASAHIKNREQYDEVRRRALEDPEAFWADIAKELSWFKPWERVLDWEPPFAKWFVGATTNLSYNCLDRHLETGGDKIAIRWEGEPGDRRGLSVCRGAFAARG